MSASPYVIEIDPQRNCLRLTFANAADQAAVDNLDQDLATAFSNLASGGDCLVLVDTRASGLLPQNIAALAQAVVAKYLKLSRRLAILVSTSSLEMMQAKRVAGGDRTAFFRDEEAALIWLFEGDDGTASSR
jgi:hypothetical protein